jgi:hypothetical protein
LDVHWDIQLRNLRQIVLSLTSIEHNEGTKRNSLPLTIAIFGVWTTKWILKHLGSIVNEIDQMGSSGEFQAFIYALFERNKKTIEETIRMQAQVHPVTSLVGDILSAWSKRGYVPDFIKEEQKKLTEDVTKQVTKQVAEETGLKNAKSLVDDGMTVEKAARIVQLPIKKVREYCKKPLNSIKSDTKSNTALL